jgi:RNAse (barnase) inhibitor barstar
MKRVTIDVTGISTGSGVHDAVAKALGFPAQYGKSLDALWHCLKDLELPLTVVWMSKGALSEEGHDVALDVYSTLEDFAREHANFTLEG